MGLGFSGFRVWGPLEAPPLSTQGIGFGGPRLQKRSASPKARFLPWPAASLKGAPKPQGNLGLGFRVLGVSPELWVYRILGIYDLGFIRSPTIGGTILVRIIGVHWKLPSRV